MAVVCAGRESLQIAVGRFYLPMKPVFYFAELTNY